MVGGVSCTVPSLELAAHIGQVFGFADVNFHIVTAAV